MRLKSIPILAAALSMTAVLHAQDAVQIDDALFTVGVTTDVSGSDYAYLLWQASDDSILKGDKSFAIYKKSGAPSSGNPFSRVSITKVHQDPALIVPLLTRSERVGQDLVVFEETITNLFQDAMPAVALTLGERVAAVIQGAIVDDELRANLMLLSRQHPAAALSLGQAWVEPVNGLTTFEIREWSDGTDLAVVGRVTLDPAAPSALIAPNALYAVPDLTPKGHLNVKLRWAAPNALRRLTLLTSGYDIFRIDKGFAFDKGYHVTPPSSALMRTLVASQPEAVRVNNLPVMTERDLTAAQSNNASDKDTWFVADDNDRFTDGGVPFVNGDEFYYFVAARDVLGNNGAISQGLLVKVCDRMPPPPPQRISVTNAYDYTSSAGGEQRLQVNWPKAKSDPDSGNMEYHVYRWETIEEMNQFQNIVDPATGDPFMRRIGMVTHSDTIWQYSFKDDGAGAPSLNKADPGNGDNAGQTFWYTVRVKDLGACGGNFSGNSAPVFGVLRDRRGPETAVGSVDPCCFKPSVEFEDNTSEPNPGGDPDTDYLELWCEHPLGPPPAFADFYGPGQEIIGRVRFEKVGIKYVASTILEYQKGEVSNAVYGCRVVMANGKISNTSLTNPQTPSSGTLRTRLTWTSSLVKSQKATDCGGNVVDPVDPFTGIVTGPSGTFTTSLGTREYKIYRRVDGGRRTLIDQGTTTTENPLDIDWEDPSPPANGGEACYFVQLFDVQGNPGAMAELGCVEIQSDAFLPTPMLAPLEGAGTEGNPEMTITWFCTPYGVERFEIWIAAENGQRPATLIEELRGDLAGTPNSAAAYPDYDFSVFETQRVAGGSATAQFSYQVPIETGVTYRVAVRAVASGDYAARAAGDHSNLGDFLWVSTQNSTGADVPWPARPRPEIEDFHEGIKSVFLDIGTSQVRCPAVRIGEARNTSYSQSADRDGKGYLIYQVDSWDDPLSWLYTNDNAADNGIDGFEKSVFSVVMYRFQVPNANRPNVSGEIVQVTPMMEQMAFDRIINGQGQRELQLRDPYVGLFPHSATLCSAKIQNSTHDLLLFDSQPVIKGASYKYLLARYGQGKEVEQVIDCGTVTIP
jgi:hypothetical protein